MYKNGGIEKRATERLEAKENICRKQEGMIIHIGLYELHICMYIYLPICLFDYLYPYLSFHISIYMYTLYVYLPICRSLYLHLSIYIYIYCHMYICLSVMISIPIFIVHFPFTSV